MVTWFTVNFSIIKILMTQVRMRWLMNEKEDPLTCVLDGYLGYSQSYSRVMRAKPQTKAFFLTHHA